MSAKLAAILKLEVPVVVEIARRTMPVADLLNLVPGAIIELPKTAEEELEILVNNKRIGAGRAVKVGENFGVRVTFVGNLAQRVQAMGVTQPSPPPPVEAAAPAAAPAGAVLQPTA